MKFLVKKVGERKLAGIKFLKRMSNLSLHESKTLYETNIFLITLENDNALFDELTTASAFPPAITEIPIYSNRTFVQEYQAPQKSFLDLNTTNTPVAKSAGLILQYLENLK